MRPLPETATRAIVAASCCAILMIVLPLAGASSPTALAVVGALSPDDEPRDCLEAAPAAVGSSVIGSRAVVDVLVLVDGASLSEAAADMSTAAAPYDKAGVDLRLTFRKQSFRSDGEMQYTETRRKQTINSNRAISDARDLFPGRKRPHGFDLVYVLTEKAVWKGHPDSAEDESRDYGIAGEASCIGGIRFPERAFAVGEWEAGTEVHGLKVAPDFTAALAAHELGHLMGAHHHYSVCGTTAAGAADRRTDLCTTMFPEITGMGLQFSPINAAVVYGHAEQFTQLQRDPHASRVGDGGS